MKLNLNKTLSAATILTSLALLGAGCSQNNTTTKTSTSSSSTSVAQTTTTTTSTANKSESSGIDWDSLPTKNVTLSDQTLTIEQAGTYVLSGTTSSGVVIKTDGNVRLILDNAKISSQNSAAILAEDAENVVIETKDGTTNTIADSTTHDSQDFDSAIYIKNNLFLSGSGKLTVTGNTADAIVAKDELTISGGELDVTAADDGIIGRDTTTITGGKITVNAVGDGIKATNDEDQTKGNLTISDGTVSVSAGDDGVKAEEKLTIDGGTINVTQAAEGLEGATITINNGTIDVTASDDGINASASNFTTNPTLVINDGKITVAVGAGDTDAIDSNGDVTINGGTIDLTGQTSTIDYDGTATKTGGTLILNGTETDEIPEETIGGRPGRGGF